MCNYLCVGALEPLLAAKVGFWQVSSGVKGKGAALGMRKLRREVHRFAYHVHVDIRNCYGSMRTEIVEGLVARYVKNIQVLYLLHSLAVDDERRPYPRQLPVAFGWRRS